MCTLVDLFLFALGPSRPVNALTVLEVLVQFVNLDDQLLVMSTQIGKVPPSTNFGGLLVNQDLGSRMDETLDDMSWRLASRRCFSFCQLL
jgi:hypothetical protein